ncbi:MAG: DUF3318 domain-containing protein [Spirulinaceae cyanobacterium RM2_2_10]|nr:DUF3318 domain-containing protein [Spirulinaceae cyanobacterium SM2_1_0]NJO19918.1 DUF3318 domain-containing protein [Spirulinaceae cyanobacterium RM2_2_10]
MNPDVEIARLRELMPASGRMFVRVYNKPQQAVVLETPFPKPWKRDVRPVQINFDLWQELPLEQRDLLFLRAVTWLVGIKWLKPDWYQGLALAGVVGTAVELSQGDAMGVLVAGGLSAIAVRQLWQSFRGAQREVEADEGAIATAQRRGYSRAAAAANLLAALEATARLEGRRGLSFREALRAQNLRVLADPAMATWSV